MLQLLDVATELPRRIPDTSRVVPKPVLPDTLPSDSAHSIASVDVSGSSPQLADIAPRIPDLVGIFESNLLWTIAVVLCALCLCLYFVHKYRSNHTSSTT